MGKQKIRKFSEIKSFENVIEYAGYGKAENKKHQGNWHKKVFKNENPITLELACGSGDYSISMAKIHPERNFIGVDIKGNRIWLGAKKAMTENLPNVAFLRTQIELIEDFFASGEVDSIWITFPDPFPKNRKEKKRLTAPQFLNKFRSILSTDGIIHLKTDADCLFEYTLNVIEKQGHEIVDLTHDIYQTHQHNPLLQIKTYYENMHLEAGKKIKYVAFRLRGQAE